MAAVLLIDKSSLGLEAALEQVRQDAYATVVLEDGTHVCGGRIAPVPRNMLWRFGICCASLDGHPVFLVMRTDNPDTERKSLVTSFRVIPWDGVSRVTQPMHSGFDNLLEHFGRM